MNMCDRLSLDLRLKFQSILISMVISVLILTKQLQGACLRQDDTASKP